MIKNDFCVIYRKFHRFFSFSSFLMPYFCWFLSIFRYFPIFSVTIFGENPKKLGPKNNIFNFFFFMKLHHMIVKYVFKVIFGRSRSFYLYQRKYKKSKKKYIKSNKKKNKKNQVLTKSDIWELTQRPKEYFFLQNPQKRCFLTIWWNSFFFFFLGKNFFFGWNFFFFFFF